MMYALLYLLALLALCNAALPAQSPHEPRYYRLPPLREQVSIQDAWTAERRRNIPQMLRKYEIDAWIVSQREYAEETVFNSLKSAKQFSARRRTTMLFLASDSDETASFDNARAEDSYTWIDNTPQLWLDLLAVLETRDPKSIAIDTDPEISFSSGLHAGELDALKRGLGAKWSKRFVQEPMLAVEYIATMPKARFEWYRKLQSTAWAMITEAFSERVITPGVTTTEDVEWWLRDRIQFMNYTTWFHPDVTIINANTTFGNSSFLDRTEEGNVIKYGDLLHVDFGVTALGMNTDTQHLAYVLHPGQEEGDIPDGLREGLKKGNRLQDIVKANMKVGKTGNEILKNALRQMNEEGIAGKVYSHPIGDWGHAAGTLIGMTNLQSGVPVLGDLPLLPHMYYSVELMVSHFVPEVSATLIFPLEEDIHYREDENGDPQWEWVYGRQERFHVVKTPSNSLSMGENEL